jgi:two-component system, OmpR family, response regulator
MTELRTILYVEDDPDIQAVARLALEAVGGYDVIVCSSGEEALRAAAIRLPDLILLDVMMPGLDGPSTLSAFRGDELLSDVPIVFVTAKVQVSEVEHYKSLGALDVIAKPFDPMRLSSIVQEIWDTRQVT